jgi:hypothetical protein
VRSADAALVAVVQGFSPEVDWRQLAAAAYAITRGVPWFASNTDLVVPRGPGNAPGNGTLVNAVRTVTGRDPVVAADRILRSSPRRSAAVPVRTWSSGTGSTPISRVPAPWDWTASWCLLA